MRPSLIIYLLFSALPAIAQGGRGTASAAPSSITRQLSLNEAQRLLLERNLAVAASRHQLEVSQALRLIAGYKPNPVLQIGAEQFPIASPVPGSVPRFLATNGDAGAEPTYTGQLTKIFERGGKRELRIAQADAQVEASRYQILDAFRTQLYQLRQAYAAAVLARENLALAETAEEEYQRTLDLTAVRVRGGDLAQMELFRVRAGHLPFQQAILDARTAYEQAGRDILNLLNATVESTGPLADGGATLTPASAQLKSADTASLIPDRFPPTLEVTGDFEDHALPGNLAKLKASALANRPDVQAARANLRAAEQAVRLAEAQRKRDVAVGVEYQRVGNDSAVGMVAQVPLFIYNNQKAAIAQAEAQRRTAEAQVRSAEVQAITDVEKANQAYISARSLVRLYSTENLVQVENLRKAAEYSYTRGETSLFEYLEVARSARQARIAANQARATYQLALWQMENAIAGGIDAQAVLQSSDAGTPQP